MTGTAAEITPIRGVDRNPVGQGCPGEITRRIMEEFKGIITGEIADRHELAPCGASRGSRAQVGWRRRQPPLAQAR